MPRQGRAPVLLSVSTLLLVGAAGAALAACGDDDGPPSPYASLDPTRTLRAPGLGAPVDIVRDEYGIPHIHAQSEPDAAFANGYVVASDRLLQLDLLRHRARGTVAELFGALAPEQIDGDLAMRMHQIGARAEAQLTAMSQSTDPVDVAAVAYIVRFADGVNFYIDQLKAGEFALDPAVAVFLDPERIDVWTPADSVAIGLLQTWSLSYSEQELQLTHALQASVAAFDQAASPQRLARAGAFFDLYDFRPIDEVATIDGFPNVGADSGTRAKPGAAAGPGAARPHVPMQLLDDARRTLAPVATFGYTFNRPEDGSNNWVVGPTLAGGKALLANDPHLTLSSPPIFHAIHITVAGGADITGVSLAGVPGVVLGHNAHVAWGATTANHDVTDFYLEDIAPCQSGGGDCVRFEGSEVALSSFDETINVGALGTITDSFTATYEVVPHHGPIIPTIANHRLVPRAGAGQAISVRYTGYRPTRELRAIYALARATDVQAGFDALDAYQHGAQSWVLADDQGNFGWTSTSIIPRRSAGCYEFNALTAPAGVAPFFVLPSGGSCEWTGELDARYIPHALNPAKGYLATANQDLTGESFDGDLLNGPLVDGTPLYAGGPYGPGLREGRITRRLEAFIAGGAPLTLDDLATVQADAHSNVGALFRDPIVAAVAKLEAEIATPGTHPELAALVTALSPGQRARLLAARDRLAAWSFETPAAIEGTPSAAELVDSSATSIFNVWQVLFYDAAFGDELALMGEGPDEDNTVTAAYKVLVHPERLRTGLAVATGEALLCDDLDTAAVESCTLQILLALDAAVNQLATAALFDTRDMDDWRWGKLHRLTLGSLAPSAELDVPPSTDMTFPGGFPRHGDVHSVDASSPGVRDFDFTYDHGPSMRHLVEIEPGKAPVSRFALPGGQVLSPRSIHFRDLVDRFWRTNEYFTLPWTTAEVLEKAEERWLFKP